jgi:hypothetical protein
MAQHLGQSMEKISLNLTLETDPLMRKIISINRNKDIHFTVTANVLYAKVLA